MPRDKTECNSLAPAMTQTPLFGILSPAVLDPAIAAMPREHAMQSSEIAAWVGYLILAVGDICSGNVTILNKWRDGRQTLDQINQVRLSGAFGRTGHCAGQWP